MSIQSLIVYSSSAAWSSWGTLRDKFNVSISCTGDWTARMYVQRRFSSTQSTGYDVDFWTNSVETWGTEPEDGMEYRIGIKTAGVSSGKIRGRLSQ